MKYYSRDLLAELEKWIDRPEILVIKGPRQSGKTTLMVMLQDFLVNEKDVSVDNIAYFDFEDLELIETFSSSPKVFMDSLIGDEKNKRWFVFIDEFQYLANGGKILKLLYDNFKNVKFIISGSSSLEITDKTAKYLVGRMFSFNLYQFSFSEFLQTKSKQVFNSYKQNKKIIDDFIEKGKDFNEAKDVDDLFMKDLLKLFSEYSTFGGYPEVVKAKDDETKRIILKNIYQSYINKDIIELLRITDTEILRKLVKALASQTGSIASYNGLATDIDSYFKQLKHYLSVLEDTYVIFRVRPYYSNRVTELKKNPKIFFIDSGLRNYLLNNFNSLF